MATLSKCSQKPSSNNKQNDWIKNTINNKWFLFWTIGFTMWTVNFIFFWTALTSLGLSSTNKIILINDQWLTLYDQDLLTGQASPPACQGEDWGTSTGKRISLFPFICFHLVQFDSLVWIWLNWIHTSNLQLDLLEKCWKNKFWADPFLLLTHSPLGWLMGSFIGALLIGKVRGWWDPSRPSPMSPLSTQTLSSPCPFNSFPFLCRIEKFLTLSRIWAQEESHCFPDGDAVGALQSKSDLYFCSFGK